ncbi:hypothetical protein GH714_026646 [Hevea brasiliensis]|uniref:histone acetyltransferase n=1 Tax=Hevea brasiliensis TaxID=3981 RepID=A0A6A6LUX2_HEVBR|nr:hypothetical protein GH714_026646 [Hevea brasiliensis]
MSACSGHSLRKVEVKNAWPSVDGLNPLPVLTISSKEQVGASESYCIDPVDLNGFFDEDGKIYGYHGLKITIWISSITFHAYADIIYQSQSDGAKGITDLKSSLQRIFAETLVESKDDFLKSFSFESHLIRSIVSTGEILQQKGSNEHIHDSVSHTHNGAATSDVKVVRMVIGNAGTGHLYSRLIPLVLLLVDGSNPIDVTDPGWELYILILPPYQHKGYGCRLVEVVNNVAISEDVYDLTVEEPLHYFQHVRTCVDVQRLLVFNPIQDAINSAVSNLKQGKLSKKTHVPRFMPPSTAIEDVRKTLKSTGNSFFSVGRF